MYRSGLQITQVEDPQIIDANPDKQNIETVVVPLKEPELEGEVI